MHIDWPTHDLPLSCHARLDWQRCIAAMDVGTACLRRVDDQAWLLQRPAADRGVVAPVDVLLPDGPGANTRLDYRYRDADNYKTGGSVVLRGRLDDDRIAAMLLAYERGDFGGGFIPSEVGLDDLQAGLSGSDDLDFGDTGSDHVWHELVALIPTDDPPSDEAMSAEAVARAFAVAVWDVDAAVSRLLD